jgi:hypothetical protein
MNDLTRQFKHLAKMGKTYTETAKKLLSTERERGNITAEKEKYYKEILDSKISYEPVLNGGER